MFDHCSIWLEVQKDLPCLVRVFCAAMMLLFAEQSILLGGLELRPCWRCICEDNDAGRVRHRDYIHVPDDRSVHLCLGCCKAGSFTAALVLLFKLASGVSRGKNCDGQSETGRVFH